MWTAHLLSSLTDAQFLVVSGPNLACYSKSTAIYAGESPGTHKIQNSIHIHLTPSLTERVDTSAGLETMSKRIPVHLEQYRERNLGPVRARTWAPSGVSAEMTPVATELGRCVVHAPELRLKLADLLKTKDKERLTEMSNTIEAVVIEAALSLCHQGRDKVMVGEIATELNRIVKGRGERVNLSAENVGHTLKKIGIFTRRLGKEGRGLRMDQITCARLHEAAQVYGGAGLDPCEQNQHCPLCTETK